MTHAFNLTRRDGSTTQITYKDPPDEEHRVLLLLYRYGKLRIGELVSLENQLGAHEVHEVARKKTTPRKMFQVIRNLREAGCPIVGDTKGLWVATTTTQIEDFAAHLELKAQSDIASMLHLRRSMLALVELNTPSLFDAVPIPQEPTV